MSDPREQELREVLIEPLLRFHYRKGGELDFIDAEIMPLIQRHCALLVAAAYKDAASRMRNMAEGYEDYHTLEAGWVRGTANNIEDATPADAQGWLAAHDAEVAERATRDAQEESRRRRVKELRESADAFEQEGMHDVATAFRNRAWAWETEDIPPINLVQNPPEDADAYPEPGEGVGGNKGGANE